jgi:hypothetical protein
MQLVDYEVGDQVGVNDCHLRGLGKVTAKSSSREKTMLTVELSTGETLYVTDPQHVKLMGPFEKKDAEKEPTDVHSLSSYCAGQKVEFNEGRAPEFWGEGTVLESTASSVRLRTPCGEDHRVTNRADIRPSRVRPVKKQDSIAQYSAGQEVSFYHPSASTDWVFGVVKSCNSSSVELIHEGKYYCVELRKVRPAPVDRVTKATDRVYPLSSYCMQQEVDIKLNGVWVQGKVTGEDDEGSLWVKSPSGEERRVGRPEFLRRRSGAGAEMTNQKHPLPVVKAEEAETEKVEKKMANQVQGKLAAAVGTVTVAAKVDSVDGMWRAGTRKAVDIICERAVKSVSGYNPTVAGYAEVLLGTKIGKAAVALAAGNALLAVDRGPQIARLGRELRVLGFDGLFTEVFDTYIQPVLGDLDKLVGSLPKTPEGDE